MSAEALKELDSQWAIERKRYLTRFIDENQEPTNPQILILIISVSMVFALFLGIMTFIVTMEWRYKLMGYGTTAFLVIMSGNSGRVLVNSLRYQTARSVFLRKSAAIKAAMEPDEPADVDSVGNNRGSTSAPFSAQAVFTFAHDRLFRVLTDSERLYFIRIASQLDAHQVSVQMIDAIDAGRPNELVGKHKHDMTIAIDEIASATIDASGWLDGAHGRHVGMWRLRLTSGTKWTFQFNEVDDMKVGLATLSSMLGDRLHMNARWDEGRQSFVKA